MEGLHNVNKNVNRCRSSGVSAVGTVIGASLMPVALQGVFCAGGLLRLGTNRGFKAGSPSRFL